MSRALVAVALGAICLLGAAAAAAARASELQLLERHRPQLRYERQEDHEAVAVEPPRRSRVYGRAVRDGGRLWLQYWLYFRYNSQDRGIVGTGRHEGDWELVQLGLGRAGRPETATFTQHSSLESCPWSALERSGADVPVVYVANGSHALYPRPGVADRPFPDPNDEARGDGRRVRPPVAEISPTSPEWMRSSRRWGGSRAGIVPGEQSSPRGPAFQPQGRWSHPAALQRRARACGSAAPGARWALPVAIAVLLATGLLAAQVRRCRGPTRVARAG